MLNKISWEGNVYLEFDSFTQKAYNEVLDTDPASPNYVGPYKKVQEKYFEYLEAKGRGEDVKSPITIFNLKDSDYKDEYIRAYLGSFDKEHIGLKKDIAIKYIPDIKLTIDEDYETKLRPNTTLGIKNPIRDSLKTNKLFGSFEVDLNKELQENVKEMSDRLTKYGTCEDCNFYVELTSKLDKAFFEITNNKDPNMFISETIQIDPTIKINDTSFFTERIVAYKNDIDFDEMKQQEKLERENGNFYKGKLLRCENKDPMAWNFNPKFEVSLTAHANFKSSDLNKTTYYKYCNPDKISFKDFKWMKAIPISSLNERAIKEWKSHIIANNEVKDDYPFRSHMSFSTYDWNVSVIGEKNLLKLCDDLANAAEEFKVEKTIDMSDSIKYYFDQDFEVFNLKDYGDEIGGSFIYSNLEFEFDYNPKTEEINLMYFDYKIEDNETGYYKQLELPPLMKNPAIQDMLIDQIDLQVNNFIAENRYGSLDDMLAAAEMKSKGTIGKETKSKDEMEL